MVMPIMHFSMKCVSGFRGVFETGKQGNEETGKQGNKL